MRKQQLPPGWDEKRIRAVIDHYENQSEEEQAAEIEAALNDPNITMVAVPSEFVPKVVALISRLERKAKKKPITAARSVSLKRARRPA